MFKRLKCFFGSHTHMYSVFDCARKMYFSEEYTTRPAASEALNKYLDETNGVIVRRERFDHYEMVYCEDGRAFSVNREY